MNTQIDEALLDKLKKILRLANDKGATPGEVEAAMGKAKALAERHQIDIAMVDFQHDPTGKSFSVEVEKAPVELRSKRHQLYHDAIWNIFRKVFGVHCIMFGRRSNLMCFVGEVTDVAICKELLPWLEDVFYSAYHNAKKAGLVYSCAAHKRGIYYGLATGILAVNKSKDLPQQEADCLAMVVRRKEDVIQDKLKEFFPKLKTGKERNIEINERAYRHGVVEGRKIKLDQLSAPKQHSTLKQ